MSRILIARHGNTFDAGDVVTRVGARTDLALSSSGKEQGVRLGKHFSNQKILFDYAFCSSLRRTRETAELVLKETGSDLIPVEQSFLTEIDYGPDENLPEDVVRERVGEKALELWETKAIPPEGWLVSPDQLIQHWKDFISEIYKNHRNKTVLVVTSNGIARFALQAIESEESHPLKLKTGAYGEVTIDDKGHAVITQWNIRP